MKKIIYAFLVLAFVACHNKEVLLPQVDKTIVATVENHSPIYMFFEINGKDTLVNLNRNNSISSTNWIFNIDKRLPIKIVIPEIIKMQTKKESSMHKSETSENYFSYSDSIHKKLAFVSFTNVIFKIEKPKKGINILFSKNKILVDSIPFNQEKFNKFIKNQSVTVLNNYNLCFEKNVSYDDFINNFVFLQSLEINKNKMYIYVY